MTHIATRQPDGSAAGPPTQVWICTFDHHDGIDIWACTTEALAYRELAGVCREVWDEALEVDEVLPASRTLARLPVEPPVEDRAAVESYFSIMNGSDPGEWFQIAPFEVIGAVGGEER